MSVQVSQGMLGVIVKLVNYGVMQDSLEIYVKRVQYSGTSKLWGIGWHNEGGWYFPMDVWGRLDIYARREISTFYRVKDQSFKALFSRGILKRANVEGIEDELYKVDYKELLTKYYARDDIPAFYLRTVISEDIELAYKYTDVYIRNVLLPKMYDSFGGFSKLDAWHLNLSRRSAKVVNNVYEDMWLVDYVDNSGYRTGIHFVYKIDLIQHTGYGILEGIASDKAFAKVVFDDLDIDYFVGAIAYSRSKKE